MLPGRPCAAAMPALLPPPVAVAKQVSIPTTKDSFLSSRLVCISSIPSADFETFYNRRRTARRTECHEKALDTFAHRMTTECLKFAR